MAKKGNALAKTVNFVVWLTGIIVALAVGFALIDGGLAVPYIGITNAIAGWVVVIATVLGAILAIIDKTA